MDKRSIVQRSSVFRQPTRHNSLDRQANRDGSGKDVNPVQPSPDHPTVSGSLDPASESDIAKSNNSVPNSSRLSANVDQFQTDQAQNNQAAIAQPFSLKVQLFGWSVHPYILVAVAWTMTMAIASVSFIHMTKVDPSFDTVATSTLPTQPRSPNPEPAQTSVSEAPQNPNPEPLQAAEPSITQASEEQGTLPLFSLGAVAFSCAVGCLLMSRRSKPDATLIKRSRSASSVRRLPRREPIDAQTDGEIRTTQNTLQTDEATPSTNKNSIPVPNVTVVSSDQSHPLDWDEPSLADHLDLRQTRPVSYWL